MLQKSLLPFDFFFSPCFSFNFDLNRDLENGSTIILPTAEILLESIFHSFVYAYLIGQGNSLNTVQYKLFIQQIEN